jgi:hypothetical protein
MLSCFEKVPRKKSGFDVHKAVKKLKRKFSLNFYSDYVLSSKYAKFDLVTDTDSKIADVAESLGKHFVKASIKHFPFNDLESAKSWMSQV